MDKILVNSEELKGISVKINSIISSIEGIEKTLDVLTTESESSWQGKAKEEAEKNFKKIKEKSGTLREQLTKRARSIEEVCSSYEKTEQQVLSGIQSLSVENIF